MILYILLITQILTFLVVCYLFSVMQKLISGFGQISAEQLTSLGRSGIRIEAAAADVAKDLSAAHARADAVKKGQHGEAADAASQQTVKEKAANKRSKKKR